MEGRGRNEGNNERIHLGGTDPSGPHDLSRLLRGIFSCVPGLDTSAFPNFMALTRRPSAVNRLHLSFQLNVREIT